MFENEKWKLVLIVGASIIALVAIAFFVNDYIESAKVDSFIKSAQQNRVANTNQKNNAIDIKPEINSEEEFIAIEPITERSESFDGATWLWQKTGIEKYSGFGYSEYKLIYMDKDGNSFVLYQTKSSDLFGGFDWSFNKDGSRVVITDIDGGPEGVIYTNVVFEKNKELFRVVYDSYGPFVQHFSFSTPDSEKNSIELETTQRCRPTEEQFKKREYIIEGAQTSLVGVKISSSEDENLFKLSKPVVVPCSVIDGGTWDPVILQQDISVDTSGISFVLPGGIDAYIPVDELDDGLEVNFK